MVAEIGYGAIFLLLLLESTVIVGLFAPGVFALIGGSFLAALGKLDPVLVYAVGWLGVFAGDAIGYVLGRNATRFSRVRSLVDRLSARVDIEAIRGSWTLWFFQFPVVIRAPVPLLLGATVMSMRRWLVLEVIATSLFVSTLYAIGYSTGAVTGSFEAAERNAAILQVIFLVLLVVFTLVGIVRYRMRRGKTTRRTEKDCATRDVRPSS